MIGNLLRRHPYPVRSLWRRVHTRTNPLLFPTIHVNEFPKSGGTWLCRMLRDCVGWRFDDNAYPWFGPSVIKHHRRAFTAAPAVTMVRDPRDVAVSYYYHCRQVFDGDDFNRHSVRLIEPVFRGKSTRSEELDAFVEMLTGAPISPAFTWGEFYSHRDRDGTVWVRYEDLRRDTQSELSRILRELGIDHDPGSVAAVAESHDIDRIRARRTQSGAHFIRKGEVGGWRAELTPRSVARIEADAGGLLGRFGYA